MKKLSGLSGHSTGPLDSTRRGASQHHPPSTIHLLAPALKTPHWNTLFFQSPVLNRRRRLSLQYHRHSAVRSSIVRVPKQTPETLFTMGFSPERPSHASVLALASEEEYSTPEHEASRGVAGVGIGNKSSRVKSPRLRVDIEQRVGPVARQSSIVRVGDQSLGRIVHVDSCCVSVESRLGFLAIGTHT